MSAARFGAIVLLTVGVSGCNAARQQANACEPTDTTVAPVLSCLQQKLVKRQDKSPSPPPLSVVTDTGGLKPVDNLATGTAAKDSSGTRGGTDESFFGNPGGLSAKPLTLIETIRTALYESPSLGSAVASTREQDANVRGARSAWMPKLQVSTGFGQDTSGSYNGIGGLPYWDRANIVGTQRSDGALSGSQLLYDFGATRADVDRAVKARDAQALKSMSAIEDVTFVAAQAYLQVQEQRELLNLARDNLTVLKGIATLVSQNETNGNGTVADVKRVTARVIDAQSIVADQEYQLKLAEQKLARLVHVAPGPLAPAPALDARLPRTVTAAVDEGFVRSPSVLASNAALEAARAESSSIKATSKPRLSVETEASGKNYAGQYRHTDLAMRGMLTLTYQLSDGGLNASKVEAANARETMAEMALVSAREDLESNVRQLYLQLASNRAKINGLAEGVSANGKARELYREQFAGGKRSLLELLDVQSSYYTAKNNEIINRYDMRLAGYGILKNLGRLTAALADAPGALGEPSPPPPSVIQARQIAAQREAAAKVGDGSVTGASSAPLVASRPEVKASEIVADRKPRESAPLFGMRQDDPSRQAAAAASSPPPNDPRVSAPLFGANGLGLFSSARSGTQPATTSAAATDAAFAPMSAEERAARKEDALRGTYSNDSAKAAAAFDIVPPSGAKATESVSTASLPPVRRLPEGGRTSVAKAAPPASQSATAAPMRKSAQPLALRGGEDKASSAFGALPPVPNSFSPSSVQPAASRRAEQPAGAGAFGAAVLPSSSFQRGAGAASAGDRTL